MRNSPKHPPVSAEALARKHEARDPHLQNAAITAVAVVLLIGFCLLGSRAIIHHLSGKRPMHSMEQLGILIAPDQKPLTRFPAPNLELDDGHATLMALQKTEQAALNGYGWIDRSNGVIHIPIDRAMDLVLSRGLPPPTNTGTWSRTSW